MAYDETEQAAQALANPLTEQFPQEMVFEFRDVTEPGDTEPSVQTWLLAAAPSYFPDGPLTDAQGRRQGFALPSAIGDRLRDNSYRADGYRFHDAMHISLATHIGRSAVLRGMLGLKRRSDPRVDAIEDGGRAIATEESLVLYVGQLSLVAGLPTHAIMNDSGTQNHLRFYEQQVADFKISPLSWAKAIREGLMVMRQLRDNKGGFVRADLTAHALKYSSVRY